MGSLQWWGDSRHGDSFGCHVYAWLRSRAARGDRRAVIGPEPRRDSQNGTAFVASAPLPPLIWPSCARNSRATPDFGCDFGPVLTGMVLPETVRLDEIPAAFDVQSSLHYGVVNNRFVLAERL